VGLLAILALAAQVPMIEQKMEVHCGGDFEARGKHGGDSGSEFSDGGWHVHRPGRV